MILTSCMYLVFLFVLATIYYILPKKFQWIVLSIATGIFIIFATSNINIYFYMFLVAIISYISGRLIYTSTNEKKKKILQIISIAILVAQLVLLKYINFLGTSFVGIFNILGMNSSWNLLAIIVPIGISYYTLVAIGYIVDIRKEKIEPQTNFLKYMLFLFYFPQLTSGPFTRYGEMKNELYEKHDFKITNILFGIQRILWGIFKKIVISERLAIIANTVFCGYLELKGINVIIGAIAFTLQLYTDFSGCIDIVLGSSQIFGIKLPENFKTPFFSKTIPEFWRRWHITLNEWFKDYIYIPLGGSRKGKIRTYINLMIIFIISGLWHGAAWTFFMWGVLNGLYCCWYKLLGGVLNPLLEKIRNILKLDVNRNTYKLMQMIITFLLTCFAFIFFRAANLSQAIIMIKNIPYLTPIADLGMTQNDYIITFMSLSLLLIVSIIKQKYDIRELISRQHVIVRWTIWIGLILVILILGYYGIGYDASNFIYQNF